MPFPWLTALKVIPWGDVIEHAPKVLNAARQLLDKQRQRPPEPAAAPVPHADIIEMPGPTAPEVLELQRQWVAAQADLARLQQTQTQMAQTLADLAEQNTRLVAAVELLRKRTRLLMGAVLLLTAALGTAYFSAA